MYITELLMLVSMLSAQCNYPALPGTTAQWAELVDADDDCKVTTDEIQQALGKLSELTRSVCRAETDIANVRSPELYDVAPNPNAADRSLSTGELTCFLANNLKKYEKDRETAEGFISALKKASDDVEDGLEVTGQTSYTQALRYLNQLDETFIERQPVKRILPEGWSLGRNLSDDVMFFGSNTKVTRPLFISYVDDRLRREKELQDPDATTKDGLRILGDIGYTFAPDGTIPTQSIFLNADLDTGSSPEKSTLRLSYKAGWLFPVKSKPRSLSLSVQPSFETDRDFNREIYALGGSISARNQDFLSMGYDSKLPGGSLLWLPELTLKLRDVKDAGGNEKLEPFEGKGFIPQLLPNVSFSYVPGKVGNRSTMSATYTHLWDFDSDIDHGLWQAGYTYRLSEVVLLQLLYRKGRDLSTADKIDEILFGIGLQQK